MSEMYTEFHKACINNDLPLIKELLETGTTNVNSRDNPLQESALAIATKKGHHNIVKYLISVKANRYLADPRGLLPLHTALLHCDLTMVKLLCDFKTTNTPISGDVEVDSRHYIPAGSTAVHVAVKIGNIEILTHICKFNPNFFVKDSLNKTALDYVIDTHQSQKPLGLLGAVLDNTTILHEAVTKGYADEVRRLIQCGADINCIDRHRGTALYAAVEANKLDMVKELLVHGCDLNVRVTHTSYVRRYQQGMTALHLACLRLHVDTVMTLLQAGASPNTRDAFQDTPLSTVCKMYWRIPSRSQDVMVIAEHLLKNNASVNISVGTSSLLEIAMGCNTNSMVNGLCVMLLSAGAQVDPLNERLRVYKETTSHQILSVPQATVMYLSKCGVNWEFLTNSTASVVYPGGMYFNQLTLLDLCIISLRKALQTNCFNIWSGISLLNLPPGSNVDLLTLNWMQCIPR